LLKIREIAIRPTKGILHRIDFDQRQTRILEMFEENRKESLDLRATGEIAEGVVNRYQRKPLTQSQGRHIVLQALYSRHEFLHAFEHLRCQVNGHGTGPAWELVEKVVEVVSPACTQVQNTEVLSPRQLPLDHFAPLAHLLFIGFERGEQRPQVGVG